MRAVQLWEFETDVPTKKRGIKVLRGLSGVAKMAVEEMPTEEIACEKGLQNVLGKLREFFMPQLEVSLPRAFETAVYGNCRQSKEGFAEYIGRCEKAFTRLAKKESVCQRELKDTFCIAKHPLAKSGAETVDLERWEV